MSIYANSNVIEAVSTVLSNGRVGRGSSAPLNVNFIVVGGGAAGTTNNGAAGAVSYAGGGGGAITSGSITLGLATDYTVVVGTSGSVTSYPNVSTGGSSSFVGINPSGGNYLYAVAGATGTTSGAPSSKAAGAGDSAGGAFWGGGGGGCVNVGNTAINPNAGQGGSGSIWFINGEQAGAFGGGGGGGVEGLGTGAGAAGGTGGGGQGGSTVNTSTPGARGSGGGGGAAGNSNAQPASVGGCGSVVFAYPTPSSTATGISYGLGGTVTSASYGGVDYTIHTFYENGTFSTRVR